MASRRAHDVLLRRREVLGVAIGSAISWAILALLILYILPRDCVVIEVLPESTALPPTSGEEGPNPPTRA